MSESNFKWTDALVAEYSLQSQPLTIWDFKRSKEVKPDYEILTFKGNKDFYGNHYEIWQKVGANKYRYYKDNMGCTWDINEMLNNEKGFSVKGGQIFIDSVKRLSDGEVFSVGDVVVHKTDGEINKAVIKKFVIPQVLNHLIWFEYLDGKDYVKDLANFEKVKPKEVLLTNDGVSIHEGDKFWYVNVIGNEYLLCENIAPSVPPSNPNYQKTCFSTEELAKSYILNNKPVMVALNEVMEAIRKGNDNTISIIKELFKSKINL